MNTADKTSLRFWLAALGIFSGLATVQIAFLMHQNRELKQAISLARAAPEPDGLKAGDQVEAFNAINVEGQQTRISYDDNSSYLLLITSTKCQWCSKTLPAWKDIAARAGGKGVRVVGVSVDGEGEIKNYQQSNGLNFEVVNFADPSVQTNYKAFSTPQTILVRPGGKVERVWQGALTEEAKNEIVKQIS